MKNKIPTILLLFRLAAQLLAAQPPQALAQFLDSPFMQGASCAFLAKEIHTGEILYAHEADRIMPPASVLKLLTTATALEVLGPKHRFATTLEYDGALTDRVLRGNLYIRGSGDPTLGSAHIAPDRRRYTPDQNNFISPWVEALKAQGVREISGSVIADERIFDNEGVSMKWPWEDLGSYYGAGCYGLSVFDNTYELHLRSGRVGEQPEILFCLPEIPSLGFHNHLRSARIPTDSSYLVGAPLARERYLYGAVPANEHDLVLRGDIPDPPLFLAQYVDRRLQEEGIAVGGQPTSFRLLGLLPKEPQASQKERKILATTYSPPLSEVVRITNQRSHNLYAEALLRTLGLKYKTKSNEVISSAEKGIRTIHAHWEKKGLDTSGLWMYDGCGLAPADKLTASFICNLLIYMATKSEHSDVFLSSLPRAGMEGTVSGILKATALQGKALLKSGSMSRVRTYAGFITKGNKQYAVALFTCNYPCTMQEITKEIEKLLLALF
ncbi:MAG: D-alanyl-D-alanine carboxypeptidase/D-alanyl-D-alanine-endopeptidase [Tannerellaceae bacterium]|jgi:D-alanyl-D-alanine carboxypeptidase/D-alanyl-D-alanine-endopeptidase (penicillin-binding protein 4)|nr:D-alanyl-D-alanine carboxypeptidase/D-alanyl-D-alanine-endopeptidase [Tannerellaceae bacterium]